LHQALALLGYLEGVVDLERDHGGETRRDIRGRRKEEGGGRKDIRGRRKDIRGRRKEGGGGSEEGGVRSEEGGKGVAGGGDGEEVEVTLDGAHDHHLAGDIVE
jgi:hypothetical protein